MKLIWTHGHTSKRYLSGSELISLPWRPQTWRTQTPVTYSSSTGGPEPPEWVLVSPLRPAAPWTKRCKLTVTTRLYYWWTAALADDRSGREHPRRFCVPCNSISPLNALVLHMWQIGPRCHGGFWLRSTFVKTTDFKMCKINTSITSLMCCSSPHMRP